MSIELSRRDEAGSNDITRIITDIDRSYLSDGLPAHCAAPMWKEG